MTPEIQAEIDRLQAEATAANQAYATLTAQRKARIEAMTLEINEEFRERIAQASLASMKAERAATDALSGAATHEWEGRTVYRNERRRVGGMWSRGYEDVRITGVVEVSRKGTEFPGNMNDFRKPKIGTAFVRLNTKSGKPGKSIEGLHRNWTLADGEAK